VTRDVIDEVDFEYATAVAEKAVRSMEQHRVPPTPNNFHTWFKYSLGTSPDLKRAIDILVGNKRKFDTTTNHDLFATYVGSHTADDTDLNNVSHQLHSVIASANQYRRWPSPITARKYEPSTMPPATAKPSIQNC
jgi:diguanylate cyclase